MRCRKLAPRLASGQSARRGPGEPWLESVPGRTSGPCPAAGSSVPLRSRAVAGGAGGPVGPPGGRRAPGTYVERDPRLPAQRPGRRPAAADRGGSSSRGWKPARRSRAAESRHRPVRSTAEARRGAARANGHPDPRRRPAAPSRQRPDAGLCTPPSARRPARRGHCFQARGPHAPAGRRPDAPARRADGTPPGARVSAA